MPLLEINLLPARKGLLSSQTRGYILALLALVLVLVLVDFALQGMVTGTQIQLDQVNGQIATYLPLEKKLADLDRMERQTLVQERYISGLLNKQKDWSTALVDLARQVPTQIHLTSVTVDAAGRMTLQGEAPSLVAGVGIFNQLSSSPNYQQVQMDSISQGENSWPFTISCQMVTATP
jgi:Tfp pilus assembly protein PilN